MNLRIGMYSAVVWAAMAGLAYAQPPAEPKIWKVEASAGLALTSGNSDTSTVNAAYDLVYDPQRRNIIKSAALFIRGESEEELTANRLAFNFRDEYKLNPRTVVFGQTQYLRDPFKSIDYLFSPNAGMGYKLLNTPATTLDVDGGAGVVWEKNPGLDVQTSGAITAGEKFKRAISANATFNQSLTALWKTDDMEDALYVFGVGIAAGISTRTQLKVELLDTYKNKPPTSDIQKNDVAVLMAIVYKM